MPTQSLLDVSDLTVAFPTESAPFEAVKSLSFKVEPGQTLAIVGESGSGKSVTSMALMRLLDYTPGRILSGQAQFRSTDGVMDIVKAAPAAIRQLRGNAISMIFQEPMTSLDPVFSVASQLMEPLLLHRGMGREQAWKHAKDMLDAVRIPDATRVMKRYPHQLSGGQRQRVMIAMALACQPRLLIADEPTTALDVTTQAQILDLIETLQSELGTAVIFITHDMGVVAEIADQVAVMWKGRKVEEGTVESVFNHPQHAYTQVLLSAVPKLGELQGQSLPRRTPVEYFLDDGTRQVIGEDRVQDTARYETPLLHVEDLCTRFDVAHNLLGRPTHRVHAVEQVSFDVYPGETLALVGESGSGKTTVGKSIQQLVDKTEGKIQFDGRELSQMSSQEKQQLKCDIQYVFQDPFASLNPRKKVAFSIAEPLITHHLLHDKAAIGKKVAALLEDVGLKAEHAERYPHEFSGGQRQRICIARALASNPRLIIADESVSALDVSTQAQVIDLLMRLQQERHLAYLFITHDMAVVEKISHRVAVMYLGQLVEMGSRQDVFESPQHAYTQKLLSAVPVAKPGRKRIKTPEEEIVPGVVYPVGDRPVIQPMHEISQGHWVAQAVARQN